MENSTHNSYHRVQVKVLEQHRTFGGRHLDASSAVDSAVISLADDCIPGAYNNPIRILAYQLGNRSGVGRLRFYLIICSPRPSLAF